jgi:PAS domain S-box-containing protein
MPPLTPAFVDGALASLLKAGRLRVLTVAALAIALIAAADWQIGNRASLGLLYILPVMAAATALTVPGIFCMACLCSMLRSLFDLPSPALETLLRFVFAMLAYSGCGLMVKALIRHRESAMEHLAMIRREEDLRREAEEQLRVLVESSPAAILTADNRGIVLACNRAANRLFLIPEGETLVGRQIGNYMSLLADALKFDAKFEGLQTAAQCQGRRADGELFSAHSWFSSYETCHGQRLAAIVVDSSEEMREREEDGLRQSLRGNFIAASAVSHELRNFCGAIRLVAANLGRRHELAGDEDYQGLLQLAKGLEKIAAAALHGQIQEPVEAVALEEVLDNLRIVIDADWRESGGEVIWPPGRHFPAVLGEPHGLLQAFLNLAQNSHRAVQDSAVRRLEIGVAVNERTVDVSFRDSGPGVSDPSHLFEPFQSGTDGSGLGLYVSRAVVRSFGGDLRFDPQATGTCFRLELRTAG